MCRSGNEKGFSTVTMGAKEKLKINKRNYINIHHLLPLHLPK